MEIDSALWTGRETRERVQCVAWTEDASRCMRCSGTGKGTYKGRIDYPGGSFQDQWHACKQCDGTGERNNV